MTGTGYYGFLEVTPAAVRGVPARELALEVELRISTDGFAPGVTAMILPSCHVWGVTSARSLSLGQGEVIVIQLGFTPREGGGKTYRTSEQARWQLSEIAAEHLEHVRDGGDIRLDITPTVLLMNTGEPLADVYPQPAGVPRPSVNPHCPVWRAPQQQLLVTSGVWAQQVLVPWQQAAAVTLVVKLPAGGATDDHRSVVRDLTDARERLRAGDWKGSIRASRDAAEVLRRMVPASVPAKATDRTVDEREAAILDAEANLIQALYGYGSATHPDPHLRDTQWAREHALLILATVTAVAQRVFSAA